MEGQLPRVRKGLEPLEGSVGGGERSGPTAAEPYVGDEQVTWARGGTARLGHGGPHALSGTGEP